MHCNSDSPTTLDPKEFCYLPRIEEGNESQCEMRSCSLASAACGPGPASRVVEVPVISEVGIRKRIVEVPEIRVIEKVQPRIQVQEIVKRVPKIETVVREKIVEVPHVETIDKFVKVPRIQEFVRHVPKIEVCEIIREVPKEVVHYVEKIVEVPQTEYVDKIVEVPQFRDVIKELPVVKYVEVPVEKVRYVPKKQVEKIKKLRHVPGPIEYQDIPYDVPVEHEVFDIVQKIIEVPVERAIYVEKQVAKMVPGEIVEVPYEVVKCVENITYQEMPGKVITKEVPYDVEHVEEVQVPVYHEVIRVVPREKIIQVDRIHEVEVPDYVDEVFEVPQYTYVQEEPLIIKPRFVESLRNLPDVHEVGETRCIYEPIQHLSPTYDTTTLQPIIQDMTPSAETQLSAGTMNFCDEGHHLARINANPNAQTAGVSGTWPPISVESPVSIQTQARESRNTVDEKSKAPGSMENVRIRKVKK